MIPNNISLILLAAGHSERMAALSSSKALLTIGDSIWLDVQLNKIKEILNQYVVVLGRQSEQVLQKSKQAFTYVLNTQIEWGQYYSIQCGLYEALNKYNSDAYLIHPIDVPMTSPLVITEMVQQLSSNTQIVIPEYQYRGGHPILISSSLVESILSAEAKDTRLDYLLQNNYSEITKRLPVQDEKVILNLNTPERWLDYLNRYKGHL